jgi:peptide/nickel transport system permease protein
LAVRLAWLWLGLVGIVAVSAPALTRNPPTLPVAASLAPPEAGLPLGADILGRDFLSRMLHGTRLSLGLASLATAIAVTAGGTAGFIGALGGRIADRAWVWTTNVLLAVPSLLLAMLLVARWGPGIAAVVLSVGIGGAPVFSKVTRAVVAQLQEAGYVAAARAAGAGRIWSSLQHILPNSLSQLGPLAGTQFGWAFLGTTTLTFLGLAGDPALPEWGAMLNAGRVALLAAPRLVLAPASAISLTILSVHALTHSSEPAEPTR